MEHKACKKCPWLKGSAQGYLGAATPLEFAQLAEADVHMPCHTHVDYEAPDWEAQAEKAPHCKGRSMYWANRCKVSKTGEVPPAKQSQEVFSTAQEFLNYHTRGNAPTVMVIGNQLVDWDLL